MTSHLLTSFIRTFQTFERLNFYTVFDRNIQGRLKAENNFYQYLEYELRFDILNLDKLVPQKRGTPL